MSTIPRRKTMYLRDSRSLQSEILGLVFIVIAPLAILTCVAVVLYNLTKFLYPYFVQLMYPFFVHFMYPYFA